MSYDIRLAVRVEGAPVNEDGEPLYAVIGTPEYDSPTYNLGDMFRACTGWDFKQGKFYRVSHTNICEQKPSVSYQHGGTKK